MKGRTVLRPLGAGALVAGLLYGLLAAAGRDLPPPEDPWLDAFLAEGLRAEFINESREPGRHLMIGLARDACAAPSLASLPVRLYQVQGGNVQVFSLPSRGDLPALPEGRHPEFKAGGKQGEAHLCRSGRHLLFASIHGRMIPFIGRSRRGAEEVELVFDAFQAAAEGLP